MMPPAEDYVPKVKRRQTSKRKAAPRPQRVIAIDSLRADGRPGISADVGGFLAEAAVVCLEGNAHASGVHLSIDGDFVERIPMTWTPNSPRAPASWDPEDATEWGACGVAALVVEQLTDLCVVERAWKRIGARRGSGFDYWLGKRGSDQPDPSFQGKTRLEVSGIRKGSQSQVASRVRTKEHQTTQSDFLGVPALVAIVEFGAPCSRVARR